MRSKRSIILIATTFFVVVTLNFSSNFAIADSEVETSIYPLAVVSVDFSDVPHKRPFHEIRQELFGNEGESLKNFWKLASSSRVDIIPGKYDGLIWERAPKPLSYYAKDSDDGFDIHVRELVEWAIEKAQEDGLNLSKYIFKEKTPPFVCVVVAGEAEGYMNFPKDDAFWPHRSAVKVDVDGEDMWVGYILVTEDMGIYGSGALVMTHEFGHLIGLADLYDYGCGGPFKGQCSYPFTYYDVMVARHGGLGLSGFHRERLGYIKPKEVIQPGEFTLPPITTNSDDSYLIIPVPGTNEYFGVEYRIRDGIDSFWGGIPSEGVIIYKVNEDVSYHHRFNDGDDEPFGIELLNPGGGLWHENPCYTSDGVNVAGPKTNPSTIPHNKNYTSTIKVTVLEENELGARVKVDIDMRDRIKVTVTDTSVKAGTLHKTEKTVILANIGDTDAIIGCEQMNPPTITLLPNEIKQVTVKVDLPSENLSEQITERKLVFETETGSFDLTLYLRNILFDIDVDANGVIESFDVETFGSYMGKVNRKNDKYDVNDDEVVDSNDYLVIARYMGQKYK